MATKIAIVAALEREVRPLIRGWRLRKTEYGNRCFRFYETDHAVLTCAGIGAEPARRAAEAIIALYEPAVVCSAGFAGALGPELKVGDVIIPRRVINASDGSGIDTGQGEGILISFASVASPEQKSKLAASFKAQAVDMEAAAVARAAEARGVRFAAVKAISDERDFALPPMEPFISPSGQFRAWHFGAFTVVRPWLWVSVWRLACTSARASDALCAWLRRLTEIPTSASTAAAPIHEVLKG
jgi:adenosylhomocysteine nucleosidase